ncbi:MAG: HAMP domain-containing histidine kinase, partial [Desulfobacterales bacterium]|nr:HAMP domain-containing histidine kinase [Desulfobacterales bacterium]
NLDTLVAHMLALSKMDYQESDLTLERFGFPEFVKSHVASYSAVLKQNRLGLDLDMPGPLTVRQDKSVLKSVLSNLLDNAIKYTEQGETIVIRARSDSKTGLRFSVTNPCDPLSSKDIGMLFKPFFRRPGQRAPGSGLGLTIARKQVQRCQGRISARNTESGLTFRVTLP